MIEPTVGRIVWYHPTANDPGRNPGTQPLAAIVTHVWTERMVNLAVLSADGVMFPKTSVKLSQDDDALEQGAAQWMPYQIGQAKKNDAGSDDTLIARLAALEESVGGIRASLTPDDFKTPGDYGRSPGMDVLEQLDTDTRADLTGGPTDGEDQAKDTEKTDA